MDRYNKIYEDDNLITSLKILRKKKLSELDDLCFDCNRIMDASKLWELYSNKVTMVRVEYSGDSQQCYDPGWLIKMQSFSIQTLSKIIIDERNGE